MMLGEQDATCQSVKVEDFFGSPVVKTPYLNAGGKGSIPGWGTKILHTKCHDQYRKKKSMKLDILFSR